MKWILRTWDPGYTKLTPGEARELRKAESGEFVPESEIDWETECEAQIESDERD